MFNFLLSFHSIASPFLSLPVDLLFWAAAPKQGGEIHHITIMTTITMCVNTEKITCGAVLANIAMVQCGAVQLTNVAIVPYRHHPFLL